jgi:hypothetical protein
MLCVATALMAAMLGLFAAVGHDQLWCLYVAQRMLRGVQLYGPELLESNPPLIMAMLLIPARAAQILGIPDTVAFKFFVVLIAAGSAAASYRLLRRRPEFRVPAGRWAGLFAFLAIFGVVPARDLGQREHLLALLCLPYVLAAVLDFSPAENRVRLGALARMAIGFAAGVGLCLKPHHLLVPAAIEAAILLKRRVFLPRIEPLAILATCLAYVAAIRVFTPLYLTSILPILRDTYWAIGHLPPSRLLGEAIELHVLGIVTLAIYLRGGRRDPYVTLLLLAGAASTVAYYLQGTGWYYQQLPAISLFGVALFFELAQLAVDRRWSLPKWMPATTAALCVLAVGLTAYFSGYTFARPLSFPSGLSDTPDPTFFAGLPPGTPVAILTTVVDDSVPPIAMHHLLWAQRENNLWTLPAILRNESPGRGDPPRRIPAPRLAELDRLQHLWMVEDLARWQPVLVLVARCQDPAVPCQVLEDRHDDLLAWFARDPAFRAAWSRYRFVRSSGDYDAYRLVPRE